MSSADTTPGGASGERAFLVDAGNTAEKGCPFAAGWGRKAQMFTPESIQQLVQAGIPGADVTVRDMTGTSDHFELVVVSDTFEGKGPVERHRMVYAAIGSAVGGDIHALALRTLTRQEAG